MHVTSIGHVADDHRSLSVTVSVDQEQTIFRLSVREGPDLGPVAETAAIVGLQVAMQVGRPLRVSHDVSERLLRNLDQLQATWRLWYPNLHRVPVEADGTYVSDLGGEGVLTFYSGGLDSNCSVVRHHDRLTHLLFAWGFDITQPSRGLRTAATRALRESSDAFGIPLIEVESNVRELPQFRSTWASQSHGAAMAATALALRTGIGTAIIPSSHTLRELFPWGTHPMTDPLFSTEDMTFVHDAAELTRVEKADVISRSDAALRNLRVCTSDAGAAMNCGRCQKCVRTKVNLAAVGALDRCTTLQGGLTPRDVRRVKLLPKHYSFWEENLVALREQGRHELADAVQRILTPPMWQRAYRRARAKAGEMAR